MKRHRRISRRTGRTRSVLDRRTIVAGQSVEGETLSPRVEVGRWARSRSNKCWQLFGPSLRPQLAVAVGAIGGKCPEAIQPPHSSVDRASNWKSSSRARLSLSLSFSLSPSLSSFRSLFFFFFFFPPPFQTRARCSITVTVRQFCAPSSDHRVFSVVVSIVDRVPRSFVPRGVSRPILGREGSHDDIVILGKNYRSRNLFRETKGKTLKKIGAVVLLYRKYFGEYYR